MERDNQEIPGFGFDPGFEPSPLPQQPTPSSNSIFGLISKVNKGILKKTQTSTSESGLEGPANPSVQQARAVAKKLSNISPQIAKQRVFQNAKTTIENIQKGIWKPPVTEQNKPGGANTGFKMPTVATVQKQVDLSDKGQGHGKVASKSQGQTASISKPQVCHEEKMLVAYKDTDRTKQTSSFSRQEALEEIDRYRLPVRGYNTDQRYEETRKKAEPFKSDFDRYYYGNETQRSEIAGKLHRVDDFSSEREFVSKQFQEPTQTQDVYLGRDFKNMGDAQSRSEYQLGIDNAQKLSYDNYQGPGSDDYGRSGKGNYGRHVTDRTGNDNYKHKSFASESKNYSVGGEHSQEDEYDPERWDYGRNRECAANESKSYQSRGMETGSFGNRRRNEKPVSVDKYPYKSDFNAYLKDTRSRNMEPDLEQSGNRIRDWQERPESGNNVTKSHSFYGYGPTIQTHDGEIVSYKTSRQTDEREQGFDSYRYSYERHNRDIKRDRGSGSGNRKDERGSFYEARGQQGYNESKMDYYNDNYYDRGRGDRYDNGTEEYGEDMANMEEFPEIGEHDSKSQDGGMLYEDFLFGEDDEEEEKSLSAGQRLIDNKGYTSRQFDNKIDRKRNVEVKMDMTKNETYDMSRNIGSDRRDSRGRDMQQGTDQISSRANFGERKVNHGFELAGRSFSITDDQKAQVGKPVCIPAQVPHLTGIQAQVRPLTSVLVQVPPPAGVPTQVPTQTGIPTRIPIQSGIPTRVPTWTGIRTQVPTSTGIPTQVPTQTGIPTQVPTRTGIPTQVPTRTGVPTQVPTQTGIPTGVPTVTGILARVPPPTGVPAPPVTVTAVIPPPGIICKDCNVTCLDEEIYNAHMKSNMHILTLQRKAQELFHMDTRKSRFDVDSTGKPLKASILPPTTMITGIPTNTLAKPVPGIQLGRNVFSGDASPEINSRRDSPTRYRPRSDSDLQVIPPKPLGPLETRSVQCTWLILQWRTRHEDEEALIDKYVVEYRNARETRWVRVGATTKHEFEVNGLQEGTDYLFRVYTTNRDERSEYLESVLITTKKRRDSTEQYRGIPSRERERDRGHRSSKVRDRRSSREIDHKRRQKDDRKPKGNKKISRDRKRIGDKKPSRDIGKIGRDTKQTKDRGIKPVKKISSNDSKQNKAGKTGNNEENSKLESKSAVKNTEEKSETFEIDNPEKAKQEDVECLLYKELPNYASEPLLGLDNIYEIRSYLPKTPPRYVCKLCNNKGSHKIIVKHIIGFPHKLNYFQKHNPEIYDIINVIALKKQQVERANYEARLEEDRIGRGSVRVMLMLNPQDNNGKLVYSDPIPVKAPPPVRKKEMGEVPESYYGSYQSQFEAFYNKAIETGTLSDSTLIGLDYVKEILHPKMEKEPKYTCSLCTVLCYNTTILWHLVGKKHRFNYLKVYQEDVYDMISNAKEQKHEMLLEKIKELAEKDGPGTIKTKVARNERMWRDRASKAEETQAETQVEAEEVGNLEEPQPEEQDQSARESRSSSVVQAIKFGIKKTESQPTNVKPINVLDQEQAVPKHKEAFDWNKENSLLQSRIHNETIIKSSRKSKFLSVYSEFFRRYPVIGMQWVTEFQKQDVKQEPWYMCFMCQQKLQWKSILDHVTSNLHRLNYMKKSDYRQMYNAVYHAIKKEKQSARPLIEQYSKEISCIEGPPTEIEVMLEININKEAFKSVAKVQENVKAHAATSSASQSSSIQINIASVSLTSSKESGEATSTAVQVLSEPKSVVTYLSNASAQDTQAQDLQPGSQTQQYNLHTPQTGQAQMQQRLQPNIQPLPLCAPLMRPPPLHPPQSATVSNTKFHPLNICTSQAQRFPMAVAPAPPLMPFQSATNSTVTIPPPDVVAVSHFAPPLDNISAVPGGPIQTMPVPFNPNTVTVRQPLIPGPRHRPPLPSGSIQRPPLMPYYSQMGQVLHQRSEESSIAMPLSVQQPLIQGKSPRLPVYSSLQTPISSTPVISGASPVVLSTAQHPSLQQTTSDSKAKRPPPWQIQTSAAPIASLIGSSPQGAPPMNFNSSLDNKNSNNLPEFNTYSHFPIRDEAVDSLESVHNKKKNHCNDRQAFDQKRPLCAASGDDNQVFNKNQQNILHDDRTSRDELRESERGIKRYGRESGHNDRNKRRRNEDRVNVMKTEKKVTSQQRSSYGRSSHEYNSRRHRDLAKGDGRDRRKSRSPYRSDRRSPPQTRQRDDNFGDQTDRFTRRSECMLSPNREIHSKDRHRETYPEERQEQSYGDEQIPTEDYNMPLDDARVEDLVRLYSDRIDDDYDNVMGDEAEWDDMMDNKFDGDRRDDYESNNGRYYHERQTPRNDFEIDGNSADGWYQKDGRGRSDYRHCDRFGTDNEYRVISNKYNQYSRRDSDRNQGNRDRGFIERGHISEDRRRKRNDMQRVDRYRDMAEKQEDHFFREAVNREGEFGSSEGEWRENFQEEDSRRQREFRRDYLERQNYRREERHTTDAFDNRGVNNRDVPVHRQRYEDDYERMFDETQIEDDGLPDPSREEIDALLRRANTVITPPCDEFSDYEDEVTLEHTNCQGGSTTYPRSSQSHHSYRGIGGPRSDTLLQ